MSNEYQMTNKDQIELVAQMLASVATGLEECELTPKEAAALLRDVRGELPRHE